MSKQQFFDYFTALATSHRRACHLLVPAEPGESVVGFWGGDTQHILSFSASLFGTHDGWVELTGRSLNVAVRFVANEPRLSDAIPLASVDGSSIPNTEEEWDEISPTGYMDWRKTANPDEHEFVMRAIRDYDAKYIANPVMNQTDRDVFVVVGGWGIYLRENEWGDHANSSPVAFTFAESEPYYSIRLDSNDKLVCKSLIT